MLSLPSKRKRSVPFVQTLTEDVLLLALLSPILPRFPFHSLLSGSLSWFNTWSFVTSLTRRIVLSAYFLAVATLKAQEINVSIPKQESALFAAALSKKASVFALFGGQGTNEVYFDELQNLYDIYKPFVVPFVQTITEDVLAPLVAEEEASTHYTFGLDAVSWLSGATARPSVPYLASVPISFPLIGLTQLVQYLAVCHIANLTPGEFRSRLSGATGHVSKTNQHLPAISQLTCHSTMGRRLSSSLVLPRICSVSS